MRRFLFIIPFLSFISEIQSQSYFYSTRHIFDIGIGMSSNITVYELGLTTKLTFPLYSRLAVEAELTYFPGTYHINELYANLNAKFIFARYKKFSSYLLAGYSYNKWYNNPIGDIPFIQSSGGNLGAGCFYSFHKTSLFAEIVSNSVYMETSMNIGIKQSIYATLKKKIVKTKSVRFL